VRARGPLGGAFLLPAIYGGPLKTRAAMSMKDELVLMFLARYGVADWISLYGSGHRLVSFTPGVVEPFLRSNARDVPANERPGRTGVIAD